MKQLKNKLLVLASLPLLAFGADNATGDVADSVTGVIDVASSIKQDSKPKFEIYYNLIPEEMNKDVDNADAKSKIDDSASHIEFALVHKANKKDPLGLAKSTEAYFSLHLVDI